MTTASAVQVPTTPVRFPDGLLTVSCEPVDDTWAITPGIRKDGRFLSDGRYTITHRATGYGVGLFACLPCVRLAAEALAATGFARAFTDSASPLPAPTPEVFATLKPLIDCLAEYCTEGGTP